MSEKIVFICTGNICRSAMAHGYMQKKLKDVGLEEKYIIESAGTNAYTGDRATDFACEVMKKYDTDLSNHRATYIEESDINEADIILCMTQSHKVKVLNRYPKLEEKVYTLKEYLGETDYIDIDDPWGYSLDVYKECAREIVYYVDKLIKKISRGE